jgi:hypothetical protein
MSWVRSNLRFGSWCGLFALAIQLVVLFNHVHCAGNTCWPGSAPAIGATGDASADVPAFSPGHRILHALRGRPSGRKRTARRRGGAVGAVSCQSSAVLDGSFHCLCGSAASNLPGPRSPLRLTIGVDRPRQYARAGVTPNCACGGLGRSERPPRAQIGQSAVQHDAIQHPRP